MSTNEEESKMGSKMGTGQVAIAARSPSPAKVTKPHMLYLMLLVRTVCICVFPVWRIDQWMHVTNNQSPFEKNEVFKIIGIVALSVVGFVATLNLVSEDKELPVIPSELLQNEMIYAYYKDVYIDKINYRSKHKHDTFFNFLGSYSAFLAPFSLTMVLLLPPKLNWIGYVLACVMFGMLVTCFCLDDHQQDKSPSTLNYFNYLVLVLVPFLLLLVFAIPESHHRAVYRVIYVSLCMESSYHFITYLLFIYEKARKPSNFKTHEVIQQDMNNNNLYNLRVNYLQVL